MRITVIGGIVAAAVEAPEVMPVSEVRPEVGLTIAAMVKRAIAAIATAAEHGRGAEAAAVETTTVEATTSTMETAAAMAATTAVSAANLDHRSVGRDFR